MAVARAAHCLIGHQPERARVRFPSPRAIQTRRVPPQPSRTHSVGGKQIRLRGDQCRAALHSGVDGDQGERAGPSQGPDESRRGPVRLVRSLRWRFEELVREAADERLQPGGYFFEPAGRSGRPEPRPRAAVPRRGRRRRGLSRAVLGSSVKSVCDRERQTGEGHKEEKNGRSRGTFQVLRVDSFCPFRLFCPLTGVSHA